MNLVDLSILLMVGGGVVGGFRLGFVTRVLSWFGLKIGLITALKLLPWMLDHMPRATSEWILLVSAAMVLGLSFTGQALGMAAGWRIRPVSEYGRTTTADRVLGAIAGLVGAISLAWLLLPIAAQTRGVVAAKVANSSLARFIDDHLPEPPDTMQALQALAGDGVPRVFDALRPTPDLGPPPADSGLSPELQARVARSIVKVEGIACNRVQEGTGFVVADGLVVTNAHVAVSY
ncbi:MAG: CvpA family protein, partial [Acidimicrobiales bacterium]|nr:CvpA family protein [Acidimicrobiales bacterium]